MGVIDGRRAPAKLRRANLADADLGALALLDRADLCRGFLANPDLGTRRSLPDRRAVDLIEIALYEVSYQGRLTSLNAGNGFTRQRRASRFFFQRTDTIPNQHDDVSSFGSQPG